MSQSADVGRSPGSRAALLAGLVVASVLASAVILGAVRHDQERPDRSGEPGDSAAVASGPVASGPVASGATTPGPSRPTLHSPAGPVLDYLGDASGATDATADIQAFIDAAADGSTIRFRSGGTYPLHCTVLVRGRTNLTIDGAGARFVVPDGTDCASQTIWRFQGGGGHVIRDMTIEGSHPNPGTYQPPREFQIGVESLGTAGLEIADVTIRSTMGDCVHVGLDGGDGDAWSEGIWIHDLDCARNGRQGIALTGARDVLIEDSRFADQAYVVFDIEPDEPPGGVDGVTIRDNVLAGRIDSPMLSIGGSGAVSNVLVEGNRAMAGANHGVWSVIEQRDGHRPRGIVIRANTGEQPFTVPSSTLFLVRRADEVTIADNHQAVLLLPPTMVDIEDACAVHVVGNGPIQLVRGAGRPGPCD